MDLLCKILLVVVIAIVSDRDTRTSAARKKQPKHPKHPVKKQPEPKGFLQCYVSNRNSNGVDTARQICAPKQLCETQITKNGTDIMIKRRCNNANKCEKNMNKNGDRCYNSSAGLGDFVQICNFCCSSDLCNTLNEIPDPTFQPMNTEGSAWEQLD